METLVKGRGKNLRGGTGADEDCKESAGGALPFASSACAAGLTELFPISFRPVRTVPEGVLHAVDCATAWMDERGQFTGEQAGNGSCDLVAFLTAVEEALPGRYVEPKHLLLTLGGDQFVAAPLHAGALTRIALIRSKGWSLTVLVADLPAVLATMHLSEAMTWWRRAGCGIGLDGFGYAPVPALWPLAHRLDLLRIDARVLGMHAGGAMGREPVLALVSLAKAMGIKQIVVDGCRSLQEAGLFGAAGATHAQGPAFGEPRRSLAGFW